MIRIIVATITIKLMILAMTIMITIPVIMTQMNKHTPKKKYKNNTSNDGDNDNTPNHKINPLATFSLSRNPHLILIVVAYGVSFGVVGNWLGFMTYSLLEIGIHQVRGSAHPAWLSHLR